MIVATTMPLFPWDALEDSPGPATGKKFLASIPDGRLLQTQTARAAMASKANANRREAPPAFRAAEPSRGRLPPR